MKRIRILLIDNHELVRRGVRSMLEQEKDMEIVGECFSAEEAIFQMIRLHPDIALMDIQLPGMNWIEAISSLKKSRPGSSLDVIILAESPDYRAEALDAGAASYLLRDITREEFTQAIRQVYLNSHPEKERDSLVEEVIELVVPPPANAAQLLRFMCRLTELLHDGFASIICTVGSWDRGTTITIRSQPTMPSNLVIELANMSEVEKVEEEPMTKGILPGFTKKFERLLSLGINPSKRLHITLKETDTDNQWELARHSLE